jgi:hypothetical protein
MKWVRLAFVYLFSFILFISLIFVALAISAQITLAHPNKIESWLSQSHIYSNLQSTITDQAQNTIENDVSGGASISKTLIRQAAQSAFPQALLQQGVHIFISSNYAWLEGKSTTPDFKIDFSGAKIKFATKVAESSVLAHLTSLPVCTAAQTTQLQSANPLLLSCRPANINPHVEANQVSQQVSSSTGFLSNPVITASSLGTKVQNGGEPYYTKLSNLPKGYQIAQKLPWVLSIISVLSILMVIFCSRSKRLGIRRATAVLLVSGILLVIDKFVTDLIFNRVKGQAFSSFNNGQIEQSLTSFARYVESELVKIDLWFGIGYIILALILFGVLIATHKKQSKAKSPRLPKQQITAKPSINNVRVTNSPSRQPNPDVISQYPRSVSTPHPLKTAYQKPKRRSGPRPPRLIQ